MANYMRPDVYINQVKSSSQSIPTTSSLVGAMVGVTKSGKVGTPVLVSSFKEFVEAFSNGLDTPYMADSYLAYSVYGFFANGGRQLYVVRAASSSAAVAQYAKAGEGAVNEMTLKANNAGTWGNGLKLAITKNEDWASDNLVYDVTVTLSVGATVTDSFIVNGVTIDTIVDSLVANSKFKKWFDTEHFALASTYTALAEGTFQLSGGADGVSDITDAVIKDCIDTLESVSDELFLVAAPGQTTTAVNNKLLEFGEKYLVHPLLDFPRGTEVDAAKTQAKTLNSNGGAIYYPWLKMDDPLTNTVKTVPTCGHIMGIYAATNESAGLGKVPAGIDAAVRGIVGVERQLKSSDLDILNPVHVNAITSRTNYGIVVWGARSLNKSDTTMRYVSDVLINYVFTKALYNGTQFAVFRPNNSDTWNAVTATIKSYLRAQREAGVLKGTTDDEAFFVSCNSATNTQETIDAGELHADVGYAPNKPAEFVIITLAHSMQA